MMATTPWMWGFSFGVSREFAACLGSSLWTFCGEVFVAEFCWGDDVVGAVVLLLMPVGAGRGCWGVCPAPSGYVCLVCCGDRWFRVAVARGEEWGDERVQGKGYE